MALFRVLQHTLTDDYRFVLFIRVDINETNTMTYNSAHIAHVCDLQTVLTYIKMRGGNDQKHVFFHFMATNCPLTILCCTYSSRESKDVLEKVYNYFSCDGPFFLSFFVIFVPFKSSTLTHSDKWSIIWIYIILITYSKLQCSYHPIKLWRCYLK